MLVHNNKVLKVHNKWLKPASGFDPYNPLNLPPYTIRLRLSHAVEPNVKHTSMTPVDAEHYIWDVTYNTPDWTNFDNAERLIIEVLGANTTGVTNMLQMFVECNNLESVPLFDTSNVTNMHGMFERCYALTSIPLLNTSKVTDMINICHSCYNVEHGALALYQQASTQANPPAYHYSAFFSCGIYTQSGAAELAQIPNDWK